MPVPGWSKNEMVRQVYARNVSGDARAYFTNPAIGWRNISGPPDAVTNILVVLSDAAMNKVPCNVYVGVGGTILSAQAPA
jgi:hypothetical protein